MAIVRKVEYSCYYVFDEDMRKQSCDQSLVYASFLPLPKTAGDMLRFDGDDRDKIAIYGHEYAMPLTMVATKLYDECGHGYLAWRVCSNSKRA